MTHEPLWQPSDILNAETEGDAESPKRRGRIPQTAWPRILERHRAGATLSAIAREFDCTPSAISYIVRKAEAAGLSADAGVGEEQAMPEPAPVETPAAEVPRPSRRPKAQAEQVEPVPSPAILPPAEPVAEPTPVVTRDATDPAPEERPSPTSREGVPGELFQHDSGRHEQREAGRRFESREGRPPRDREGRERDSRERDGRERDGREREGRFSENGGRSNDRGEARGGPQEGRRPQQGVPRFPQGGQRFAGRDRQDGRETRPPRDFERAGPERSNQDRLPPVEAVLTEQPVEVVYPYRQQQRNPARLEAQETPTVPADERMDLAAKACAEAYRVWKSGEGDVQSLGDTIHELRKVIARMEIEVSASRKEEQRPIPLPSYRRSQPPPQVPRG